jgi:hypothetical protein
VAVDRSTARNYPAAHKGDCEQMMRLRKQPNRAGNADFDREQV